MIGKTITELDRVDSTNAFANLVLSRGEQDEGTVIWAHEQFEGRGQHNHKWISKAGKNLTFTVILKPRFLAPDQQFLLNKAVSLSVLDFIRNSLSSNSNSGIISVVHPAMPADGQPGIDDNNSFPGISIKWPNDIYIGNKKIGGILIEHKIMGSSLESSLVGIGLNINQTRFSSEIPNPVSLIQLLHTELSLKEELQSVCRCLELRYNELRQKNVERLNEDYHHALLGFDKWRKFTCKGAIMDGKIKGVDSLGRLLLESGNGEVRAYNHGEIEYLLSE